MFQKINAATKGAFKKKSSLLFLYAMQAKPTGLPAVQQACNGRLCQLAGMPKGKKIKQRVNVSGVGQNQHYLSNIRLPFTFIFLPVIVFISM